MPLSALAPARGRGGPAARGRRRAPPPRGPPARPCPAPPRARGGAADEPSEAARALQDVFASLRQVMERAQAPAAGPPAARVLVQGVSYQPPGCPEPLLRGVGIDLPPNSVGLIYGRSGAGKTTLLNIVAGLAEPTAGAVSLAAGGEAPRAMGDVERGERAGMVFQFPERHFIGATLGAELTLSWPRDADAFARQARAQRLLAVLRKVGLDPQRFPLDLDPRVLSDGYKRRLALAAQLVRGPGLLLLDEPLAGLDFAVRGELVALLGELRSQCTLLIVSHDLRELAPLVDRAWEMTPGGVLEPRDVADLPVAPPPPG